MGVVGGGLWRKLVQVLGRDDRGGVSLDGAERILLEADFGVEATTELIERIGQVPAHARRDELERAVVELVGARDAGDPAASPGRLAVAASPPTVILVYGVNGVGKTTTVAKLANRLGGSGQAGAHRVLLAAADTFRAGAATQLRRWAELLDIPCVGPREDGTGDPAAVAFDAIDAAAARGFDTVVVDTAGRMHTEARLLDELKKVVRVVAKRAPGAPHESLLVLDGTAGQNAVHQAREFAAAVPLTGLVVTKLDGTARGGSVVAVRRAVKVPIRFLGTGEGLDDLTEFDPRSFARRLIEG